ncbi:MAG TPA: hypothetical protein VFQ35_18585 [Polyangiaceae bacterium]|nr:hypothetical protein [Polyangiaceae bacterium]
MRARIEPPSCYKLPPKDGRLDQRQAWVIWGSAWIVLLMAGSARALSRTVALTSNAPSECESAEHIEVSVDELVRRAQGEPLRASLSIVRTAAGYSATLQIHGTEPRSLSAPSCEAVVEAVTVILALAIDPQANTHTRRAPKSSPEEPKPAVERRPSVFRFDAGAASTFDTSTLPHVALGASAKAGLWAPRWSIDAVATYWLPASRSLPNDPTVGGRFTWWTVGISGCVAFAERPYLAACVEPELGRLEGSGSGTLDDRSVGATWLAVSAAPAVSLDLTRHFKFRAALGPALTLLGRHAFVLERSGENLEVHRPGRLSLRGRFGLDVLF